MKNVKKVLAVALVLCTVVMLFAACGSPERKLVGTAWEESTGGLTIEFQEGNILTVQALDGKSSILNLITDNIRGSYSVEKKDDGQYYLTITISSIATISGEYLFNIEGQTLTLSDPSTGNARFVLYEKADEAAK